MGAGYRAEVWGCNVILGEGSPYSQVHLCLVQVPRGVGPEPAVGLGVAAEGKVAGEKL